jgi:hypothetical protein
MIIQQAQSDARTAGKESLSDVLMDFSNVHQLAIEKGWAIASNKSGGWMLCFTCGFKVFVNAFMSQPQSLKTSKPQNSKVPKLQNYKTQISQIPKHLNSKTTNLQNHKTQSLTYCQLA